MSGWVFNRLAAAMLCVAALLALLPHEARAAPGFAGQPLGVCVLRDAPGMTPAQLFRHPERFDCTTAQARFGSGDYWLMSQPLDVRSTPAVPLFARIGSVWEERLSLHVLYADGTIATQQLDGHGVSRAIQLGAIIEQPVPASDASVKRLLWHVAGSANTRGILLGPHLATAEQSRDSNLLMAALYACFGGLCLALLVYNLAMWAALRHQFQLYYCGMVAALLAYAFTSSGALAWATDIANNDRLRINYLLLGACGSAALLFARSFFEAKVFQGWLSRLTLTMAAVTFGGGALFFFVSPYSVRWPDALFTCAYLGFAPLIVAMIVRGWMFRSKQLGLFALAWAAPIASVLARTLAGVHVLGWSFWLDNSTLLGMAAEALLSSVAIAYRIRRLTLERDEAQERAILARRLADTDPLTGLLNRRAFLEQAIGRPGEQSLLIADIDHFKRVNETLGHDGGDEVLRVFSRLLRSSVPSSALVARLGGEEFAILTHSAEPVEPEAVLARLRATRMPFDLSVTASIGLCTGPLATEVDWKRLYRGADSALFAAKSGGRDRARGGRVEAFAA